MSNAEGARPSRLSPRQSAATVLVYWAYRLGSALAVRVPPRLAYPTLDRLGELAWALSPRARRVVESNLRHVVPSWRHRRRAARGVFRHAARNYYDTFRIPRLSRAELEALVQSHGWEHVDAALARGRGVIMVGAHLSSVGLAAQAIAARGYTVQVPVEPIEPPELLRLLVRLRAGFGLRVVPLGPKLGAELLAALRRNEVVGLIVDRNLTGSAVTVPFFGAPARLPAGPALLAIRSGAPILPGIALRRPDGRFAGVIEPPISFTRSGSNRKDVDAITRAIAARLEYYIRRHPEQWTVFQPVWDTEPESDFASSGSCGRNRDR
jgi:phosphatidylinositol dimannoside acyltransferase